MPIQKRVAGALVKKISFDLKYTLVDSWRTNSPAAHLREQDTTGVTMQHRDCEQNDQTGLSRRQALKSLGVAGAVGAAGAAFSSNSLFGQKVDKSTAKGGRIDVHHHHAPPALRTGPAGRGRGGYGPWTPELSLMMMDKYDISVAILSMTQMGDILY